MTSYEINKSTWSCSLWSRDFPAVFQIKSPVTSKASPALKVLHNCTCFPLDDMKKVTAVCYFCNQKKPFPFPHVNSSTKTPAVTLSAPGAREQPGCFTCRSRSIDIDSSRMMANKPSHFLGSPHKAYCSAT